MLQALKDFVAWLRKQPVVGPILNILNTRKGMIAVLLTGYILQKLPELEKVHGELDVVVGALVTLAVIWLTTSLGYAYEDAAAKGAQPAVSSTITTTGATGGTTATATVTAQPAQPAASTEVYAAENYTKPAG